MDKWTYLGTDDIGTKVYVNENNNGKYRYKEVDKYGKITYHN